MTDCLIVIPARLKATRLPDKPLADIGGEPMIVHVWRRAVEADCGPVVVATDAEAVRDAVLLAGGKALITRADHASGSDRVFETIEKFDPKGDYRHRGQSARAICPPSTRAWCEAASPRCATTMPISAPSPRPSCGRRSAPTLTWLRWWARRSKAERCSARSISPAPPPLTARARFYHHIGIYAYRRQALKHFVSLPPSPLELREKLEQLRALEAGMRIHVGLVDTVPLGVDTPADLKRARELIQSRR